MSAVDSQKLTAELGPLEFQTLADLAFKRMRQAIFEGELPLGRKLSEVDLARTLGISRGPLREALRRLEERKLIERTPRIGISVVKFDLQDVIHAFQVREMLEGLACRLATEHMSDAELAELEALVERQKGNKAFDRGLIYAPDVGDLDFHRRIAQGSRNVRLCNLLSEDFIYLLSHYRSRSASSPRRAKEALKQHHAIFGAMKARNAGSAESLMRKHIRDALATFTSTAFDIESLGEPAKSAPQNGGRNT